METVSCEVADKVDKERGTVAERAMKLERSGQWVEAVNLRKQALAMTNEAAPEEARRPREPDLGNSLVALGELHVPTKRNHNYLPMYDHVFGARRKDVRTFVEIGVQSERSVRMWRDYFPNARVIGVDIDPDCKRFEGDRIEIVIGDQLDCKFLSSLVKVIGEPIDIVVDDGLHTPEAIFRSFSWLYPALASDGIYAMEDLVNLPKVQNFLFEVQKAINYWPEDVPGTIWQALSEFPDAPGWFIENTVGLEVYRYLAFVKRGFNPRDNPYFRSEQEVFGAQNRMLKEVDDAAVSLKNSGQAITKEALVSVVGFQKRYCVDWYLGGLREANWDSWRTWMRERRARV